MGYLLLVVVLIEGFTTLAMQMAALRNAVPLVGSSIVLTSVVIGVILLALAVGYRTGGKLTERLSEREIARLLARFLFISGLYYLLLVFPFQQQLLADLVGELPYTLALFCFSLIFFFIPVALASHTMPMITQLTKGNKGFAAGKILFVSTIGSFLGSVVTSTVLFPRLGVSLTGYLVAAMLILCHILLMVFLKRWPWRGVLTLLFMSLVIPVTRSEETSLVSYDSPYQHIEVREETNGLKTFRTMLLNGGYASSIDVESGQSRFGYIRQAIEATDMWTLLSSTMKPKTVLVIGAAGFTYPQEIAKRGYIGQVDALDVDPAVKEITEKYFHQHSLDSKIRFIPQSARGFLREAIDENVSYDYVLVDAYIGTSLPEELVTKEFFIDLERVSNYLMLNMIMDTKMETTFAKTLMQTLGAAWPGGVRYKYVSDGDPSERRLANFLITSRPFSGAVLYENSGWDKIYTDDRQSVEIDKAAMFYGE